MATKKELKRRKMFIAGGIGGGVLILAALLMTLGPGSKQVLRGSITVIDTGRYSSVEIVGSSCYTSGGYSDISSGTNVTVKNGEGKLLVISDLSEGVTAGSYSCRFDFELELPSSEFYSFDIGNRDEVNYSKADLESRDWTLDLSLGD